MLPRTCEPLCYFQGQILPSALQLNYILHKTPAGDVPIRSVSLASDGSFLVAGNNKVSFTNLWFDPFSTLISRQGKCYVWKVNEESSGLPRFQAVTKFHAHNKYLTRCLLSPDAKWAKFHLISLYI